MLQLVWKWIGWKYMFSDVCNELTGMMQVWWKPGRCTVSTMLVRFKQFGKSSEHSWFWMVISTNDLRFSIICHPLLSSCVITFNLKKVIIIVDGRFVQVQQQSRCSEALYTSQAAKCSNDSAQTVITVQIAVIFVLEIRKCFSSCCKYWRLQMVLYKLDCCYYYFYSDSLELLSKLDWWWHVIIRFSTSWPVEVWYFACWNMIVFFLLFFWPPETTELYVFVVCVVCDVDMEWWVER